MNKKLRIICTGLYLFFYIVSLGCAETAPPSEDDPKQTKAGKYVSALEAYNMWKANPNNVKILDIRTPEEYVYVGHPAMAYNIPFMVWTGKWNSRRNNYDLQLNADFVKQVNMKFAKNDTILVLCRSGVRSAAAANRLSEVGFVNVYNIIDGFEGDMVYDLKSYYHGKRMKNGWKNSGAPWTYQLNPNLIYKPQQ